VWAVGGRKIAFVFAEGEPGVLGSGMDGNNPIFPLYILLLYFLGVRRECAVKLRLHQGDGPFEQKRRHGATRFWWRTIILPIYACAVFAGKFEYRESDAQHIDMLSLLFQFQIPPPLSLPTTHHLCRANPSTKCTFRPIRFVTFQSTLWHKCG
jgi:hypothetical protein